MGVSPRPWSTECPPTGRIRSPRRPVRPSPSAPRCSSARRVPTPRRPTAAEQVQPTVRRPAPSRRPARMPGGEAIPTSASTRTTRTRLTAPPGRRAVSQLSLALALRGIRHHWAHQLAPSISEPGEASQQASAAKHDRSASAKPAHQRRIRRAHCRRRDACDPVGSLGRAHSDEA